MTTRVSLFTRMLIGISPMWCRRAGRLFSRLKRLIYNVRQWRIPIKNIDIETFLPKRPHRVESFLLSRPSATDPDFNTCELPIGFGLTKSIDDATERFLD